MSHTPFVGYSDWYHAALMCLVFWFIFNFVNVDVGQLAHAAVNMNLSVSDINTFDHLSSPWADN